MVTPGITINPPKAQENPVVEEYRLKQKLQLEQDKLQKQNSNSQDSTNSSTNLSKNQTTTLSVKKSSQPFSLKLHKGSYQPMDSSLTSLQTIALKEPTPKLESNLIL